MKKSVITISFLLLVILFASPVSASAETKAGIKPGSFFYFFDTTFEKIGLFFTFSPEKKAQKALEYASERLTEIEDIAEKKDIDAIKTAITNYESNVALATEKSKEVKDKGQAENLLNLIADNTSKNQEVLSAVLIKVPEEAKEAIMQAIETSRKNQEEAIKQIAELKGEVEQLKQEVAELKTQNEEQEKIIEEVGKQKTETLSKPAPTTISTKSTSPQTSATTVTPKPTTTEPQNIQTATTSSSSTLIITSPSSVPQISKSPTSQEIKELQEHQDENKIDMTTIITPPPSSPICRTDADLVWGDSKINNNLDEFIYFWFPENQYYIKDNFPYFGVENNNGKIIANIPVQIVNKKNFPVTYKLLYWISDVSNITVGLTEIKSTSLPIVFDLPQDYFGHKVSFQLFFYYDCVSRIWGPNSPGIKALRDSIITLDIPLE